MTQEIKPLVDFNDTELCLLFKTLIMPLEKYYGVDFFCYRWISPDGMFFRIANPSDTEFYFCHNFHKSSVFNRHPDNYYNGTYLPAAVKDTQYRNDQTIVKKKLGLKVEETFIMSKKIDSCAHLFSFGTKNAALPLTAIALNNLSLFHRFCVYFLSQWQPHLARMTLFMINISDLIGWDVFQKKQTLHFGTEQDRKKGFLKSIGVLENVSESLRLSSREIECLWLMKEGKTMNEIAQSMHISPRTVEHLIEKIKGKLNADKRDEIFSKIDYLQLLGIF